MIKKSALWLLAATGLVVYLMQACSNVEFSRVAGSLDDIVQGERIPDDVLDDLPTCDGEPDPKFEGCCIVFHDSFENRTEIAGDVFYWDFAVFDNGTNAQDGMGRDLDVKIENENHLGHVIDGDNAVMFRGRQGGSVHDLYLVSKPLPVDLTGFDRMYFQYDFVPIDLEGRISLHGGDLVIPESIRIDVCNNGGINCNDGSDQFFDIGNWTAYENTTIFALDQPTGAGLNIRQYSPADWLTGQAIVDLENYPAERLADFVFRVSASMDEGYFDNDRNKKMEDGVIMDNFYAVGCKTQ